MQLDAFMKIEQPGLPGESTDGDHATEIEILSFEHNILRPTATGAKQGTDSKKPIAHLSPVRLIKQLDKATPKLLEASCKGTIFGKVTLALCQPTGTADQALTAWGKLVYFEVVLEKVHVASIRCLGDPALHYTALPSTLGPAEELELGFRKIKWMYKGASGSANIGSSWNLDTNAAT